MAATERHVRRRRHRDDPHRPDVPYAPATGAVVSFNNVEKRYTATDLALAGVSFDICNLGVVFQDYKLLPNRTVYENVAYALQVTGGSRREIRDKVPDILRLTGLSTKLHNLPHQLSGGEQQRVSVARAFVNHPPLLIADEPTGNLDPETSIGIMQLLYRINQTGSTVMPTPSKRPSVACWKSA